MAIENITLQRRVKLEEMERLSEAATAGPWVTDHAVHTRTGNKTRAIYAYPAQYHCVEIVESSIKIRGECIHNEADWQFIAASRSFSQASIPVIKAAIAFVRGSTEHCAMEGLMQAVYDFIEKTDPELFKQMYEEQAGEDL